MIMQRTTVARENEIRAGEAKRNREEKQMRKEGGRWRDPGEARGVETSINQSAHVESRGSAGRCGAALALIKLQTVPVRAYMSRLDA